MVDDMLQYFTFDAGFSRNESGRNDYGALASLFDGIKLSSKLLDNLTIGIHDFLVIIVTKLIGL
jgi:hypothetical protein